MPFLPLLLWLSLLSTLVSSTSLVRRQVSIAFPAPPPSQCSPSCGPVNNEIGLGCPVTACCTTTFESQYYTCLECIGTALHVANYSNYQNSLNLLYTTCVDIGFVLPRMELPGQSNSTSNSTGSATGSGGSTSMTSATVGTAWHIVRAEMWISVVLVLAVAAL